MGQTISGRRCGFQNRMRISERFALKTNDAKSRSKNRLRVRCGATTLYFAALGRLTETARAIRIIDLSARTPSFRARIGYRFAIAQGLARGRRPVVLNEAARRV